MKVTVFSLALFFIFLHGSVAAQDLAVIKDLRAEWKVFSEGKYVAFEPGSRQQATVYFTVEPSNFQGMYLRIESPAPFTLFINGQLTSRSGKGLVLNIDTLAKSYATPSLQMAVHQDEVLEGGLKTQVISKNSPGAFGELLSPHYSSFRDFAIIGIMVLLIMLIIITQLNPKLASDYFSVTKIFSMREGEDGQSYSRITSSINILFYAYSSLMLGYYLMILFHFLPEYYPTALFFQSTTFWDTVLQWAELSLIVLGVFFVKIVMVFGLSYVFGMKAVGGVHFFNWVRLLVGVFGVLTVVLFLYFISHGHREGFYDFLLITVSWVLAGWMVLIIFKLWRQLDHSMFHLFSYICATELIPFLVTIKVLYY